MLCLHDGTPCLNTDTVPFLRMEALPIHFDSSEGDVLVFMSAQEYIEGTCSILAEKLNQLGIENVLFRPM